MEENCFSLVNTTYMIVARIFDKWDTGLNSGLPLLNTCVSNFVAKLFRKKKKTFSLSRKALQSHYSTPLVLPKVFIWLLSSIF